SADVRGPEGIATVLYSYDGAGNRLSESWSDSRGAKHYECLPGNYLIRRGAASYAWGEYGQLISKAEGGAGAEYLYNAQRLMNQVKVSGSSVANYEYDALGRRVKAVEGGATTITLHCGNDIVYEVHTALRTSGPGSSGSAQPSGSGVGADAASGGIIIVDPIGPISEDPPPPPPPKPPKPPKPPAPEYDRTVACYLLLNGKYLAKVVRENSDPAQTYFCHTDMVGSIRAITDSAGQVVARFEYEPFGLLTMPTGPMAGGAHRFTGKPEDDATGLYYFGARHYDPQAGRFTARDPARQGLNWYAYAGNNPLRFIDPDGQAFLAALRGIMIHEAIYGVVETKYCGRAVKCNTSVMKILEEHFGLERNGDLSRPDIVITEGGVSYVYEIKPESWARAHKNRIGDKGDQLNRYVNAINRDGCAVVGNDSRIQDALDFVAAALGIECRFYRGYIFYEWEGQRVLSREEAREWVRSRLTDEQLALIELALVAAVAVGVAQHGGGGGGRLMEQMM
ncbi:MAG: RHS repeat-associated core domain-containing protein, partial [Clostridia bacterium]|nr:RHS repeat-associated core domain-containing protein [Clostridia bacterium]